MQATTTTTTTRSIAPAVRPLASAPLARVSLASMVTPDLRADYEYFLKLATVAWLGSGEPGPLPKMRLENEALSAARRAKNERFFGRPGRQIVVSR